MLEAEAGGATAPRVAKADAWRWLGGAFVAAALIAIALQADGLGPDGRWTLAVFVACLAGWTLARLDETVVASIGVVALLFGGALSPAQLGAAAGHELVLLLAAAALLAHALMKGGLVEPLMAGWMHGAGSFRALAWRVGAPVAATAFLIPSTTARAALLLPVFAALATALGDSRQTRALALLFPTVILLSAAASLTGAGAHLVAVEFMAAHGGVRVGFADWALLGLPFAALSVAAAIELILRLFLTAEERARAPRLPRDEPRRPLTRRQRALLAVLGFTVLAWLSAGWHGLGLALPAALAAAIALAVVGESPQPRRLAAAIEWRLLLFVVAALALGEAVVANGLGTWLGSFFAAWPNQTGGAAQALMLAAAVAAALLAHLLLPSRTARATVLIPAVALPAAALGLEPVALVLLVTMASGYCQTTPLGAKAIALFGRAPGAGWDAGDLLRLALALAPVMAAVSLLCATVVWPALGQPWLQEAPP